MTQVQPATPEPQAAPAFTTEPFPGYAAWQAEDAKRRAALAVHLIAAKASLFDVLEAADILLVTVDFDGSGDSGQIEAIMAFDAHGEVALPEGQLPCIALFPGDLADPPESQPVRDVIEALAYDLLEEEHGGWENNDGASGEFRFDVADRAITLTCHTRIMTSDTTETSW